MKLALGGPRQDRAGAPVMAAWAGPKSGTATPDVRDIGRVLYLQGVVVLLTAPALLALVVLI